MFEERNLKLITAEEVKKLCVSCNDCRKCPLRDKDGFCRFMNTSPNNWRLD